MEAAIVLGVVGLVIGGIWVAASAVTENEKIQQTIKGTVAAVNNIQNLVSRQSSVNIGDETSAFTDMLMKANAFPQDWSKNGLIVNPYGGQITVRNIPAGVFDLSHRGLSYSACLRLINMFSSAWKASSFSENQGAGRLQLLQVSPTGWQTQILPYLSTGTECSQATSNNVLTLTFSYTQNY